MPSIVGNPMLEKHGNDLIACDDGRADDWAKRPRVPKASRSTSCRTSLVALHSENTAVASVRLRA
jgi:hypothetical protein